MKYKIEGTPFPVVICDLEEGEQMACQSGAMAWMTENMKMATNAGGKGLGGMLSRVVTGEGLFQNVYTAEGKPGTIAFGVTVPGDIIAVEIGAGATFVAQKGAFVASEIGVKIEVALQKAGAGFFGGEGFILQKFSGNGTVFLSIDGSTVLYDLAPDEKLIIDTNAFAAAESTVKIDVQMVKGFGNIIAGGEGMFSTTVTGPGKVWLQTLPMSALAQAISRVLPKK